MACTIGMVTILLICLGNAEDNGSLDELLRYVPDPRGTSGDPIERNLNREFIRKLESWPPTAPAEERRIATTLWSLFRSGEPYIRRSAASALGRRNRREYMSAIVEEMQTDPDCIKAYLLSLPDAELNPPLDLLRRSFRSKSVEVREMAVNITEILKAYELRPELERMVTGDPVEDRRKEAALILGQIGSSESVTALRQALRGSEWVREAVAWGLGRVGSDPELDLLIPLLASESPSLRSTAAAAIGMLRLEQPNRAADVLVTLLEDPDKSVRMSSVRALAEMKDPRVVPAITRMLEPIREYSIFRGELIEALARFGPGVAVPVLNKGDFRDLRVRRILANFGHPSTGYAAWEAYLADPIVPTGTDIMVAGHLDALDLLKVTADAEVFKALRLRETQLPDDSSERSYLKEAVIEIGKRFPELASAPVETLATSAIMVAPDRDGDGVGDRVDTFPDDPRRARPEPLFQPEISVPTAEYYKLPSVEEGPAANPPIIVASDDNNRFGWVTRANETEPPDYHVGVRSYGSEDDWPMPNPGDIPGVTNLVPLSVNVAGTVVGKAYRTKVAIPLRQNIREVHFSFQSGFVFEGGKLRLDPPPPFRGSALNVSYRRINNKGLIFGHREVRDRKGGEDVYRTVAFLGTHLFRDVGCFEVTDMTDKGQLLCYRESEGRSANFIWDGEKFQDLGSLAGMPDAVCGFRINERLQVIGLSDAFDPNGYPIGFFWENGKMLPFVELIPEDMRPLFRSAIPYRITNSEVHFRAEQRFDSHSDKWEIADYVLEFRPTGPGHNVRRINVNAP